MAELPMVRIAELEIDPAQLDRYKRILATQIAAAVKLEPGVIMLHAVSLQDLPHHVRILEYYQSKQAYEAHIASPHFLEYKASTADMVTSLRLIEVDPILMAAKSQPLV